MNAKIKITCLIVAVVAGAALWMHANQVTAQPAGGLGLGVCDPHKVFSAYKKTLTLRANLANERDRIKLQIDAAEKDRKDLTEELTAGRFTPGSEEYERRRSELLKKTIENDTFAKVSDNELRRQDMLITQVCYEDVYKTVAKVAKRKALVLVLTQDEFTLTSARVDELLSKIYYRRPVLYADSIIDITAEVTEQLNLDYDRGR